MIRTKPSSVAQAESMCTVPDLLTFGPACAA
jgi:hypothetical protein